MRTIDDLVEHINKYKDSVIIVGKYINDKLKEYDPVKFNEDYSRKSLKRTPDKLWNFFRDYLYTDINDSKVYDNIENIPHSLIVDQNINGKLMNSKNVYNIHGHINTFICSKCKTIYTIDSILNDDGSYNTECEVCGKEIRPSVLLSGERYNNTLYNDFKQKLIDTHTLILIGMDYSEQTLLDLIADYGDLKSQVNAEEDPDNQKMLVILQSEDCKFNPAQITFPEYLVKGNIDEKLDILSKKIKD